MKETNVCTCVYHHREVRRMGADPHPPGCGGGCGPHPAAPGPGKSDVERCHPRGGAEGGAEWDYGSAPPLGAEGGAARNQVRVM